MPDLTGGPPDGPAGEPPATPGSASGPRRPGGRLRLARAGLTSPTSTEQTGPPREPREQRPLSPAVETLLRRTGLAGERTGVPRGPFRAAGLPVLIAAVVAGGPGWTTYLVRDGDSLTAIARRHGTDARALALVNGMSDADRVET